MRLKPWFTTLVLLAAMTAMAAAEPSPIPLRFSASIGGFLGTSYQVELHDGVLTCTTRGRGSPEPKRTTVTPTAAKWHEFRETLDAIKVWDWSGDYSAIGIMDGTQWSLEIAFADHAIKTHGSNSYPDATGKPSGRPEQTETFKRYREAVKKLTDGKVFE